MSASATHSEVELTSSSTATSKLSSIQSTIPATSTPPPLPPNSQGNSTATDDAIVTSIFTTIPTNTLTTTTFTQTTNNIYISTTTQSPVPDPTTTAALAAASKLLDNNTSLSRTTLVICIALAILAFLLLIALLVFLFIYIQRRRRRRTHDEDNSPPLTSLGPEPTPAPGFSTQPVAVLPVHMRETSLSMGPRMGTLDQYSSSQSQTRRNANSGSFSGPVGVDEQSGESSNFPKTFSLPPDPGTSPGSPLGRQRLSRSFPAASAPNLPDVPSLILPLSTSPNSLTSSFSPPQLHRYFSPILSPVSSLTPSPSTPRYPATQTQDFAAANMTRALKRKPSLPLYHKALQEQATHQRERAGAEQAGRLGLPVITFESQRESVETDMSFEGVEEGSIPERSVEGAGAGPGGELGDAREKEMGDGVRRDRARGLEGVI